MASANFLLHPVRMRIMQTLVGNAELTTAQLRERIPDVPPATMYRHVAALARAGVLEVVRETPVRGTVERSYRLRQDEALIGDDARARMTRDDHRQAFAVFTGAMVSDFDRYLTSDDADPPNENVLYRQGAVWVTDEEFAELVEEIEAAIERRTTPGDGRARHLLSLAFVPDKPADPGAGKEDSA